MDFKPFKIGKYLLLERLATGGMAEVYRAKASGAGGFEKQLAVKRILPTYSTNEEFRRMFEYEARLSSMLTHANIVQIYDFVKSGDTYLLAMEYCDGKNLRQFINKAKKVGQTLSVEFAVYVINEVCKGLEYAHKKKDDLNGRPLNIIHRDMSPQNIMLSYDGAVKIVDFGIAKAKDRVDETRSGVIKGKFGYMSPEQANGESVDHRTDIFSTGIILFELLTGRRLFSAENDMATLKLIQGCVIPPPARINPKISSELEKLLLRSLTKDLALRYQSAGAFHRSLQEYLNKYYPTYTQKEVADVLQKVFAEEIENEKRRFEQIYRQSIPFSQGDRKEQETNFDEIEDILDGEITKSEEQENTAVTFTSDTVEPESDSEVASPDGKTSVGTAIDGKTNVGGSTRVDGVFQEQNSFADDEPSEQTRSESVSVSQQSSTQVPMPSVQTLRREEPPKKQRQQAKRLPEVKPREPEQSEEIDPSEKMPTLAAREESRSEAASEQRSSPRGAQTLVAEPLRQHHRDDRMTNPSIRRLEPSQMERTSNVDVRRQRPQVDEYSVSGSSEKIALETPRNEGPRRARQYYTDRDDYGLPQSRSKTMLSFLTFVAALGGTVFLYSIYLDKQLGWILEWINGRHLSGVSTTTTGGATGGPSGTVTGGDTGAETGTGSPTVPPRKPTASDCEVEVDSDPVGAQVVVNGIVKGTTSTVFGTQCGRSIDLTLKLDGYETISENLVVKDRKKKLFKSLKKVPMGALELTLNRNAKVYVNGDFVKEVRALEKLNLPLRAGIRYRVRFVNEIFGIDTTKEFFIEENQITRRTVELEEPPPTAVRPGKRRR